MAKPRLSPALDRASAKRIARAFAKEGAQLVLAGRTPATLESTAEELRQAGAQPYVIPTDVTDEAQVAALFAQTLEHTGRVDIVVNNAGVFDGGPIEELSLATWQHVLAVNLTGPFRVPARRCRS